MSKETFKECFKLYRSERLLKECLVCSDLYHGFKEAWNHQQKKIKSLKKKVKLLDKVHENRIEEVNMLTQTIIDLSDMINILERDKL